MKTVHELMNETKKLKEEFIERKLFLAGQLGVLDKKINSLIKQNAYEYEFNDTDNDETYYALNLRKELKELELKRREYKDELKIIADIDYDNKFTYNMLGYTVNEYSKIIKAMKRLEEHLDIRFKNNGTTEYSIVGKNNDEIELLVAKLKEDYSKVFINKEEQIIYCYNNCRAV